MPMALPTTDQWTQSLDFPSKLFGSTGFEDVELYETDEEFVLSIEMPGFEREEIDVNWYEGRLTVSADHEDEVRNKKKTYHRTFRMPKEIEPEEIEAQYRNGVLEVRLPILKGTTVRGEQIEVKG